MFNVITAILPVVLAKLSVFDIANAIENVTKNNQKEDIVRNSIVNPIFGYLFESDGSIANLRFYGPLIQMHKDSNHRKFSMDSVNYSLIKLIIELFPSPSGTLNHCRNLPSNFGFIFKSDLKRGLEFLANVFVEILQPDIQIIYDLIPEKFNEIRNLALNKFENEIEIFNNQEEKMIKLMVIHSFILNILNTSEELEQYLKIISNKLREVEIYQLNFDVIDKVKEIEEQFWCFPFSSLNQPPSNDVVHLYYRETDTFDEIKTFSDCADILILHICNCILYDSDNRQYSIASLNPKSRLAQFYRNHPKLFTINLNIRKEWSRVIQGLHDFNELTNSKYKLHKIVYLKNSRNELDTGIINMMNVLINLFEINHEDFWSDFDSLNIETKLGDLMKLISPDFQKEKMKIRFTSSIFKEYKSKYRIDFEGVFYLDFNQNSENKIVVQVKQNESHAEMNFLSSENNFNIDTIKQMLDVDDRYFPIATFKNYCLNSQNMRNFDGSRSVFNKIYFSGPTNTNQKLVSTLETICQYLVELELANLAVNNYECSQILKNILLNILNTVNLEDHGTNEIFEPFFFYFENMSPEKITNCWSKSFDFERTAIYKLWEDKILNLKIKTLDFKFFNTCKFRIEALFDQLQNFEGLESLRLWSITTENIGEISKGLPKINNLISLDISDNYFGEEGIKCFSLALKHLNNLQRINLSEISLGIQGSEYISESLCRLPKLQSLKLARNEINLLGSFFISKSLSQLPNLQILDISSNNLGTYGILNLLGHIKNYENIRILTLSNNEVDDFTDLAEMLKKFPNLIEFNFSRNKIGFGETKILKECLLYLINLRKLNLSECSLNYADVNLLIEFILNNTNIHTLNLSKNLEKSSQRKIFKNLQKMNIKTTNKIKF